MQHLKMINRMRQLIRFAIPLSISSMVVAFSTLINTKIIGMNKTTLYLFSIFSPVSYFMIAFQESFRAAAMIIASNYRLMKSVHFSLVKLLCITLVIGWTVTALLNKYMHDIVWILRINPLFIKPFQVFFKEITIVNLLLISGSTVINAFITGLGFNKIGLLFSVLSSAITTILLYIQMKFVNTTIHTLVTSLEISGSIMCSIMICFIFKWKNQWNTNLKISLSDFYMIVNVMQKISFPVFLSYISLSVGLIAFHSILATYGLEIVAGYYVGYRLQIFIILPAISIGSAMAILMNYEISKQSNINHFSLVMMGCILSFLFYEIIGYILYYFRDYFVNLIVSPSLANESAVNYLKYIAKTYGLFGFSLTFFTFLEQMGYGFFVLMFNFFYFLIIFSMGKYFVSTHHTYISFYQIISYANVISGLLVVSLFYFFKKTLFI